MSTLATYDTIFNRFFGLPTYTWQSSSYLNDEVTVEKDGSYKLTLEVPGFSRQDVNLTVKENTLIVEMKRETKQKKASYRLGKNIDQENIKASCKDGILTISCPIRQIPSKAINVNVD